jgi:hypothetical protein
VIDASYPQFCSAAPPTAPAGRPPSRIVSESDGKGVIENGCDDGRCWESDYPSGSRSCCPPAPSTGQAPPSDFTTASTRTRPARTRARTGYLVGRADTMAHSRFLSANAAPRTVHAAPRTVHAAPRTVHPAHRTVHAAFQAVEAPFRTSSAGFGSPGLRFRTSLARFRAVERRFRVCKARVESSGTRNTAFGIRKDGSDLRGPARTGERRSGAKCLTRRALHLYGESAAVL